MTHGLTVDIINNQDFYYKAPNGGPGIYYPDAVPNLIL